MTQSRPTRAKAFDKDVFIDQERKLSARRLSDTIVVSTVNDVDLGSEGVTWMTSPGPCEKS